MTTAQEDIECFDEDFMPQVSVLSNISRHSDPDTLMSAEIFSRQCTEIDDMVSDSVDGNVVDRVLRQAVSDCKLCVTIGDPRKPDCPLIAVSDEFEAMTGYSRNEIIGRNCRVLNRDCLLEPSDFNALRTTCKTGQPFTKIILNRKKSGELFLNLIDIRGLVVATEPRKGKELWFLVGIQADVTHLADRDRPNDHLPELQQVVEIVRARLTDELSTMAVSGALISEATDRANARAKSKNVPGGMWWLLPEPQLKEEGTETDALRRDRVDQIPEEHSQTLGGAFRGISDGYWSPKRTISASAAVSPVDPFQRQKTVGEEVPDFDDPQSMLDFLRHQTMEIDNAAALLCSSRDIKSTIRDAIADSKFCVSIGDPRTKDCPLIAVSTEFEKMTGYSHLDLVGNNCRLLNQNCNMSTDDRELMHEALRTGAPFTKVLLNRRKNGELFLNLLDMRGLSIARNPQTGEDLWFLVGIQADVSHFNEGEIPEDHLAKLHQVAANIRGELANKLSMMAVSGTCDDALSATSNSSLEDKEDIWWPCIKARWKPGGPIACSQSRQTSVDRIRSRQSTEMGSGVDPISDTRKFGSEERGVNSGSRMPGHLPAKIASSLCAKLKGVPSTEDRWRREVLVSLVVLGGTAAALIFTMRRRRPAA
mmetsp:Transcript_60337/g.155481  ORF Transcript_60337/g.155481 Transcript_60337/m.155481 type:complete len:649 (+) Transcript_60337:96-2042(+)